MAILPTAVPMATVATTPTIVVPDLSAQVTDLQNRVAALEAVLKIGVAGDVTIKCATTLNIDVATDVSIKSGTNLNLRSGAGLSAQAGAAMTLKGAMININ